MSELRAFSSLSPQGKAMFLARVAHMSTVRAREAYIHDYDSPDGLRLRISNEFIHRVTGYIMVVLDRREGVGQDASVMEMIEQNFVQSHGAGAINQLVDWLYDAQSIK